MNKRLMVQVCCIALLMALVAGSTCVFAQRGSSGKPGGGMNGRLPARSMRPVLKAADNGIFVLTGSTLTKYDAVTLKQLGALQLAEKKTDQDKRGPGPRMQPPIPAEMLLGPAAKNTQALLVVIGDKFFNIDTAKFVVSAKGTLPAVKHDRQEIGVTGQPQLAGTFSPDEMGPFPGGPGPDGMGPAQGNLRPEFGQSAGQGGFGPQGRGDGNKPGMQMGMSASPNLQLELRGNTLYILRANDITAVNIADGKVTGTVILPKPERSER